MSTIKLTAEQFKNDVSIIRNRRNGAIKMKFQQ
jgi:hypothetical protein